MKYKEMKRCPFCGNEAWVMYTGSKYYPRCKMGGDNEMDMRHDGKCVGNQGWVGYDSREEAIEAWNKRESGPQYHVSAMRKKGDFVEKISE